MNERYAKCISFDKNVKGRIGGNPPKCIYNPQNEAFRLSITNRIIS